MAKKFTNKVTKLEIPRNQGDKPTALSFGDMALLSLDMPAPQGYTLGEIRTHVNLIDKISKMKLKAKIDVDEKECAMLLRFAQAARWSFSHTVLLDYEDYLIELTKPEKPEA